MCTTMHRTHKSLNIYVTMKDHPNNDPTGELATERNERSRSLMSATDQRRVVCTTHSQKDFRVTTVLLPITRYRDDFPFFPCFSLVCSVGNVSGNSLQRASSVPLSPHHRSRLTYNRKSSSRQTTLCVAIKMISCLLTQLYLSQKYCESLFK